MTRSAGNEAHSERPTMSKISRIVKSAHKRAGSNLSLKQFARTVLAPPGLALACKAWLAGKGCK